MKECRLAVQEETWLRISWSGWGATVWTESTIWWDE
jgi:hypothetical protein